MGEYRTTAGEKLPSTVREKRLRGRRNGLLAILIVLLVYSAGHWIRFNRYVPASGYLTSEEYAEVRPEVSGPVTRILVSSGDFVSSNTVLACLEDGAQQAALEEAEQLAEKAAAELALRETELVEKRRIHARELEKARLRLEHARDRMGITRQLADMGLASGWELADQEFNVSLAEANFLMLEEADVEVDERGLDVLRGEVAVRRAAAKRARVAVEQRRIRSPIRGRAVRFTFHIGEVVRPDNVLYEIFGGEDHVLRLRVPERHSNRVAVNQRCRALFDAYPGWPRRWFHGRVVHLRDLIQTDARTSYRVVYVVLDPTGKPLTPGATVQAGIRIGRQSLWEHIFDR